MGAGQSLRGLQRRTIAFWHARVRRQCAVSEDAASGVFPCLRLQETDRGPWTYSFFAASLPFLFTLNSLRELVRLDVFRRLCSVRGCHRFVSFVGSRSFSFVRLQFNCILYRCQSRTFVKFYSDPTQCFNLVSEKFGVCRHVRICVHFLLDVVI